MKAFFVSFLALFVSTVAFAGLSPVRHSGESYETARYRNHLSRYLKFSPFSEEVEIQSRSTSPERLRKPLNQLNIQDIPDVGSYPDLEREFKHVRDGRFIANAEPFARRLTWMYPDDGCYARAEMAALELAKDNFTTPKKIFVFGNLKALTRNSPDGAVEWWYHVAVTYRVGNEAYVFDPAIDPSKPVTLLEWNKAVGGERELIQYTVCSEKTFDPNSDCLNPRGVSAHEALEQQMEFLTPEWDRLLELNRDPEKELGNEPPWL